jgi:hypothetical protein
MIMGEELMFKQYNYMKNGEPVEFSVPPFDYNYNVLGLSKQRNFVKGELSKTDYYGWVDSGGTYHDLILTEYRDYYRKDRLVYKRKLDIDWYLSDGSVGASKTTYKHYTAEESLKLGERRRRNLISDLKIYSIGLIQLISGVTRIEATNIGLSFMSDITLEITKYIEGIEDPLKNKTLTYTKEGAEWLDEEIPNTGGIIVRHYLYSAIDIDYSDKIG